MTRAFPEREDCDRVPSNEQIPLDTHPMMPANDSGGPGAGGPDGVPSASPPLAEADVRSVEPPATTLIGAQVPCNNLLRVRNVYLDGATPEFSFPQYSCMELVRPVAEIDPVRYYVREPTMLSNDNVHRTVVTDVELPPYKIEDPGEVEEEIFGEAEICIEDIFIVRVSVPDDAGSFKLAEGVVVGVRPGSLLMSIYSVGFILVELEEKINNDEELWSVTVNTALDIPAATGISCVTKFGGWTPRVNPTMSLRDPRRPVQELAYQLDIRPGDPLSVSKRALMVRGSEIMLLGRDVDRVYSSYYYNLGNVPNEQP